MLSLSCVPKYSRTSLRLSACSAPDSMSALTGAMPVPVAKMSTVSTSSGGTVSTGNPLPITSLTLTCTHLSILTLPPQPLRCTRIRVYRKAGDPKRGRGASINRRSFRRAAGAAQRTSVPASRPLSISAVLSGMLLMRSSRVPP